MNSCPNEEGPDAPLGYALQYLAKRSSGARHNELPSAWSAHNKHPSLLVFPDGIAQVDVPTFERDKARYRQPVMIVKAERPVNNAVDFYYFEVEFLHLSTDHRGWCGIGLSHPQTSLEGTDGHQFNYFGDGHFRHRGKTTSYGPMIGSCDTVGCGFRRTDNTVFFTRNGLLLGSAARSVLASELYPQACLGGTSTQVKVNFGQRPFKFDVQGYCAPYYFSRAKSASTVIPGEIIHAILRSIVDSDNPHHLSYILSFYRHRQRTLRALASVCRFWGCNLRPLIFHTITVCDRHDIEVYAQLIGRPSALYPKPELIKSYIHILWIRSRDGEPTANVADVNRTGRSSLLVVASTLLHILNSLDELYMYGIDDEGRFYRDPFQSYPPYLPGLMRMAFRSPSLRWLHTLRFHAHRLRSVLTFLRIVASIRSLQVLQVDQMQFDEPITRVPSWLQFSANLHQLDVKDCQHSFSLLSVFLFRSEITTGGGRHRVNLLNNAYGPLIGEIALVLSRITSGQRDEDIDFVFNFDMLQDSQGYPFAISFPADGCRTSSPSSTPHIQLMLSDANSNTLRVVVPWNGAWAPDVNIGAELAQLDVLLDAFPSSSILFSALDAETARVDPLWVEIASKMPCCNSRNAVETSVPAERTPIQGIQ